MENQLECHIWIDTVTAPCFWVCSYEISIQYTFIAGLFKAKSEDICQFMGVGSTLNLGGKAINCKIKIDA